MQPVLEEIDIQFYFHLAYVCLSGGWNGNKFESHAGIFTADLKVSLWNVGFFQGMQA